HAHVALLAVADHGEVGLLVDADAVELGSERGQRVHAVPVHRDDHVARAAGEPRCTRAITTPLMPALATRSGSTGTMPMLGSVARPCAMSCGTMRFTRSTGIAKPTPLEAPTGDLIALVTPMRRPALSRSGPPELPGLIAASVWITPTTSSVSVVGRCRSSAL